ncbi:MAG: hypothetical protein NUV80_05645 [Candidatus Berkelbacteria bacterium]|nr:hypothetical protein [Candidatus Berkelbacteria bacterium]
MTAHIVTYDLNKESKRPPIVEEVKKSALWAKLSESSYAINTNETATQVYKRFEKYIDDNDNLYVIGLHKPWNGFGPKAVNNWLDQNLRPCS